MSRTFTVDGTDVTALARVDSWAIQMKAHAGEVAAGSIIFDDTTGTADPASPLKYWQAEESEATPTVIGGGYINERRPSRGPLAIGAQRQWQPVLEDFNTALMDRVLKGRHARRPAETDVERITWLSNTGALSMFDDVSISSDDPEDLERTNFRGKYPFDVLNDCVENANKNFYAYYQDGTGWVLYYGPWNTTGADDSDLSVSDVAADIDSSTVFGASDISYELDPGRIYSRLLVKWKRGWVVVKDAGTESDFRNRQMTVVRENFRSAIHARRWGNRQLEKMNEEVKRLSFTMTIPAASLGEVRAGMRIQVKLTHLGISAYTWFRIVDVTFRWRTDGLYDVALVMRDKIRAVNVGDIYGDPETTIAQGGSGGGGVGNEGQDEGGPADMTFYTFEDWDRTLAATTDNTSGSASKIGTVPDWTATDSPFDGGNQWMAGSDQGGEATIELDPGTLIISTTSALRSAVFYCGSDDAGAGIPAGDADLPTGIWRFDFEVDRTSSTVTAGSRRIELLLTRLNLDPGEATALTLECIVWLGASGGTNPGLTVVASSDDGTFQDDLDIAYSAATRYTVEFDTSAEGYLRATLWEAGTLQPGPQVQVAYTSSSRFPDEVLQLVCTIGDGTAQTVTLYPISVSAGPQPGQRVEDRIIALGDASTTTFTLPQAPVPGTTSYKISGLRVEPESEDTAAPSVTFDAAPSTDARITYSYTVA